MSPFEVVHYYQPRELSYIFLISHHVRVFESAKSFARRVQDLHVEITKQIQASNAQDKLRDYLYRQHNEFNIGDYFMIWIRPEQYPSRTNR
jgi:hypothetical protein